jgi:hypothetical protein
MIMFISYSGQTHCPAITTICNSKESFEHCRRAIREFLGNSQKHMFLKTVQRSLDMD